jgi:hypothetical protein
MRKFLKLTEVEEWLYTLGLSELYLYFEEDGWTSLERISQMTDDDIRDVCINDTHFNILVEEIDNLREEFMLRERRKRFLSRDCLVQQQQKQESTSYTNSRAATPYVNNNNRRRSFSVPRNFDELADYIYAKYGFTKTKSQLQLENSE